MRRAPPRGLTLVELMVTVAVTVVLLGMAVPSFVQTFARLRMEGMVNELSVDLQYARSTAIRRRADVSLQTSNDGSMYTIRTGDLVFKAVILPMGTSISGDVTVTFEPLRGLANAAQMDVRHTLLTPRLRATTNALGRVQVCSPDGDFGGYGRC